MKYGEFEYLGPYYAIPNCGALSHWTLGVPPLACGIFLSPLFSCTVADAGACQRSTWIVSRCPRCMKYGEKKPAKKNHIKEFGGWDAPEAECTKIARFSAAAAAIFTAPQKIVRFSEAPRCAISSAKKIASEPRFLLRRKWVKMVLAAEFPAIPSSAVKVASERRCAILVHSARRRSRDKLGTSQGHLGHLGLIYV